MKTLNWILLGLFLTSYGNTYAQSFEGKPAVFAPDGLLFSQTNYGSTARFKGMGGAQIGVGGDLSSLSGNPAGLALFSKSEMAITPEFNQMGLDATYLQKNTNTNKSGLNLNQFAAAFYTPIYKRRGADPNKGVISAVFGLGYNRTNNYLSELNYGGNNNASSVADYFALNAVQADPNKLWDEKNSISGLAYKNRLINQNSKDDYYHSTVYKGGNNEINQSINRLRKGSVSEFNFAGSLNISNQVYIGGSVNLVSLRYIRDEQLTEAGNSTEFNRSTGIPTGNATPYKLLYTQNQEVRGSGFNAKIGLIYRPIPAFRLGLNFQTPTWFNIDDSYTEGLDNSATRYGTSGTQDLPSSYNLATPLKGSLGASYVIANRALITADVDFVDYSSIRFSANNSNNSVYADEVSNNNMAVKNSLTNAINYRVGAEVKVVTNFSVRAGYGINGSPVKNDPKNDFQVTNYTGGLGYRNKDYYFDIAYQRLETNATSTPYNSGGTTPTAVYKITGNNVFLTFGLRF